MASSKTLLVFAKPNIAMLGRKYLRHAEAAERNMRAPRRCCAVPSGGLPIGIWEHRVPPDGREIRENFRPALFLWVKTLLVSAKPKSLHRAQVFAGIPAAERTARTLSEYRYRARYRLPLLQVVCPACQQLGETDLRKLTSTQARQIMEIRKKGGGP